jgi:2-iminobutanoate/2-iminopropanoate deaminase
MDRAVKITVFLTDIGNVADMNAAYAEFFPSDPPARTTVQVGPLPKGALVEIDAVAVR